MTPTGLECVLAELPEAPGRAADSARLRGREVIRRNGQATGLDALLAYHLPGTVELSHEMLLAHRFSSARLSRLVFEAFELLESAGLQPVLLKGLSIAARYYPEPWLRPSVDVDVLVSTRSLDRAARALDVAGWRQVTQVPQTAFEYSKDVQFIAPKGGMLELHFGYSADFQARIDVDALLARSESVPLLGRQVRVLSKTDDLLVQCVHAAHHGFEGVKWLYDLKLLAMSQPDWRALPPLAREYRVASAVGMALSEAKCRVRAPVPRWVLRELVPGALRSLAARTVAKAKAPEVAALGTSLLLADRLSLGLAKEAIVRPLASALTRAGLGKQAKQVARALAARISALQRRDL